MKLRKVLLATCVASVTMAWGCGGDSAKPGDTSILEDLNTTDTDEPDVAQDITGVDTTPDTVQPDTAQPDIIGTDVPTEEVAEDVAVEEVDEDTAVEDTTGEDTADEEVVIPTSPILKRGDRCDELSTLGVDTLPLVDTVADTSIFTDRYIYTLGPACGGTVATDNWGDSSPDVVYTLTPALDGFYTIKATPTATFDLGLMVTEACPPRNESDLDDAVCLGAADGGREGAAEMIETHLTAGVTYFIVVDGFDNDVPHTGGFTLDISLGEDCTDRIDNDDNGDMDCADAQCADAPACNEANTELYGATACSNETDDDGDGFADCLDTDCALAANCVETLCEDTIDNNDNGFTDCDDPGCEASAACGTLGDICGRPATLTSGVKVTLNTCGLTNTAIPASTRPGCSSWSTSNTAPDLWYKYTATVTGTVRVLLKEGSSWDAVVNVIDGTSGCPTAPIAACLAGRDTPDAPIEFNATAGNTYYVIVDGWGTACGAAELTLTALAPEICDDSVDNDGDSLVDCADDQCFGVGTCPAVPPGDTCDAPIVVDSDSFTTTFNTCTYQNDYEIAGAGGCIKMGAGRDAVATFTASTAGSYIVKLGVGTGGTYYDRTLNVVKSSTCPATAPTTCAYGTDTGSTTLAETIRVEALAGEQFWIIADAWTTGCGIVKLEVTKLSPEVCDDNVDNDQNGKTDCEDVACLGVGSCRAALPGEGCANAVQITTTSYTGSFDTCTYSNFAEASGNTTCKQMGTSGDVVVAFTAPENGNYKFQYDTGPAGTGSSGVGYFDSVINVVKSTTCPTAPFATCFASADGGDPEKVFVTAVAGETFWVFASGYNANCGTATLTMNKLAPEVCSGGLDEDEDGATDCADSDCASSPFCNESATADGCTDGVSNDNDTLVDCADTDCAADATACPAGLSGNSCEGPIAYPADATNVTVNLCNYTDRFVTLSNSGGCVGVPSETSNRDIVFSYTATTTGRFAARAATTNANIILYRAPVAACLNAAGDRKIVAECTQATNAVTTTTGTERLDFDATAGETYYFIVDTATADPCSGTTARNVVFDVVALQAEDCSGGVDEDLDGAVDCFDSDCFGVGTCPAGLPGDSCAAPLVVNSDTFTATVNTCTYSNKFAGSSAGGCKQMGSRGDLLATFTATETGSYIVNVNVGANGTYFDRILNVVKSSTCPAAAPTTCAYGADVTGSTTPETIRVEATAGDQFWIIVDGYYSTPTDCGLVKLDVTKLSAEVCDDDADNDQNGRTDCNDTACANSPACNEAANVDGCSDSIDNDENGLTDCADPTCFGAVREAPLEDCEVPPAPLCTTDIVINALPYTDTGRDTCDYDTVYDYTASEGCETDIDPSLGGLVYAYTATVAETIAVTATPIGTFEEYDYYYGYYYESTIDIVLNLTKGCGPGGDSVLSCDDSSDGSSAENGEITLAAGETVFIHVNLYETIFGNDCGDINLNVTRVTP